MKDKFFIDTNILVYTFDSTNLLKQKKAQALVNEAITNYSGVISYQVVQEFLNVATKKFATPLTIAEAKLYLTNLLLPLCEIYPSADLYQYALDIKEQTNFSFYDSLIIAAALRTGCRTLYTEDLHDGQKIADLTLRNPFHSR